MKEGWAVYCPHTQTRDWENEEEFDFTHEDFMRMDLEWVKRSDAMAMVPGWNSSKGAREEFDLAQKLNMPIYFCEANKWINNDHLFEIQSKIS